MSGNSDVADTPFITAVDSTDYDDYIRPIQRGLITPLINGRSSGGAGPDTDSTEPLDAMQALVASLGSGDSVYLAAWFFESATTLTSGIYAPTGATTTGALFAAKAQEGVKVRIIFNDFDPISGLDKWENSAGIVPLDAIIAGLPAAAQDNLKYVVSMHPAHFGPLKSAMAGQGFKDINIASYHQKCMVARRGDEMFAFCGGLDIESRKTPAKWSYTPGPNGILAGWHDLHVKLEGPIAYDVERELVMRWNRECGSSRRAALPGWAPLEQLTTTTLSSTDDTDAKKPHVVQMLRTVSEDAVTSPYDSKQTNIRDAYRRGISRATKFIYIENQYFNSGDLADWIVAAGTANPSLLVIIVINSYADDGANPLVDHSNFLQYTAFKKLYDALGASRVRLYTMTYRAVHAKFIACDDNWMCVGSANANLRSFVLDSELNIQTTDETLIRSFRTNLWAHDLGVDPILASSWAPGDFFTQWDAVAATNAAASSPQDMNGEGIVAVDYTAVKGTEHSNIPNELVELDVAPDSEAIDAAAATAPV